MVCVILFIAVSSFFIQFRVFIQGRQPRQKILFFVGFIASILYTLTLFARPIHPEQD